MACGESGTGRLPEPTVIFKKLIRYKVKYERTFAMDPQIPFDYSDTKKKSTLNEQRVFLLLAAN